MATMTNEFMTPEQAIPQLVADAEEFEKRERRTDTRYPFFRQVLIHLDGDKRYSAYARNISQTGIGLMHTVDLPLCDVELTIVAGPDRFLKLRARVERCESCSYGIYFSGLSFL
jgi:hypothetical protein